MSNLPVPIGGRDIGQAVEFTDALNSAAGYARAEKSEATRRSYLADWKHFEGWCRGIGSVPLPAGVDTVCGYVASLADSGKTVSTINRRCAAIGYVHRAKGLEPPTSAEDVKKVLRGIRRKIGTKVRRKSPATAQAIRAMLKLIPDTLSGRRDRALLLLGFAAALRRSELVGLTVEDIERAPEGIVVHIQKSKTDQEGQGHQVAVPSGSKLGVVTALDAWIEASGITTGPLFRSVDKGGNIGTAALSGRTVADIVKHWAAAGKLDPKCFSGHSLRAGFVTTALDTGADLLNVMKTTRHKSVDTVQIYDRRSLWKNHAGSKFL